MDDLWNKRTLLNKLIWKGVAVDGCFGKGTYGWLGVAYTIKNSCTITLKNLQAIKYHIYTASADADHQLKSPEGLLNNFTCLFCYKK